MWNSTCNNNLRVGRKRKGRKIKKIVHENMKKGTEKIRKPEGFHRQRRCHSRRRPEVSAIRNVVWPPNEKTNLTPEKSTLRVFNGNIIPSAKAPGILCVNDFSWVLLWPNYNFLKTEPKNFLKWLIMEVWSHAIHWPSKGQPNFDPAHLRSLSHSCRSRL